MKTLLTTLVFSTVITATVNAEAADHGANKYLKKEVLSQRDNGYRYAHGKRLHVVKNDRYSKHYRSHRRDDQRFKGHFGKRSDKHFNQRTIRLDLPVNFRGDGRLRLKQLARQYHGINVDDYRLVRVMLDSHGRRDGAARLRVGEGISDLVYLGYGRSVIHAPSVRGSGQWVLKLDDARVSNVCLELQPRPRHHRDYSDGRHSDYSHSRRQDRSDWFANRAWKSPRHVFRW